MPSSEPIAGLILASGSPRRREAFERLFGRDGFRVILPDFDETVVPFHRNPATYVETVSQEKCRAFLESCPGADCFVVTADTIVTCGGRILGKPEDAEDARNMLRILSGRSHRVMTAVSMAFGVSGRIRTEVETTRVWFSDLDARIIDWYVSTGEPMDKAGAYGIQEQGAVLVSRIRGCYQNVIGLPVRRMLSMMERFEQDPGSHFLISGQLPWRQDRTTGGTCEGSDESDQGHAQDTAPL